MFKLQTRQEGVQILSNCLFACPLIQVNVFTNYLSYAFIID